MPISAILFGGRRRSVVPLVTEAFDWSHGVFLGSIMASETTAAATGAVGALRRDPFAMLPFCGYNMADYFAHWLRIGAKAEPEKLPRLYFVNWFRRDAEGRFLWPGYGENSRVLAWIFGRVAGTAEAVSTPIGTCPPLTPSTPPVWPSPRRTWPSCSGSTSKAGGPRCPSSRSTTPASGIGSRPSWLPSSTPSSTGSPRRTEALP